MAIMKQALAVYWARRDLRILDNPALSAAITHSKQTQSQFLPLFIVEDYMTAGNPEYQFGFASRWFIQNAIPEFAKQFEVFGLVKGKAAKTIIALSKDYDITIFVNEDIYPDFYKQINKLRDNQIKVKLYADALTVSKETKTGSGKTYSVFTPFKNAVWEEFCTKTPLSKPDLKKVKYISDLPKFIKRTSISADKSSLEKIFSSSRKLKVDNKAYDIDLLIDQKSNLEEWYTNEDGALAHFDYFLKHKLSDYKDERNQLDRSGTSRMSLALAWGFVSARTLVKKIEKHYEKSFSKPPLSESLAGPTHYISELIWREFYKYLFYHHPNLMNTEFQEKFRNSIKWEKGNIAHERFTKWIKGQTGYPIVDAAMMELATSGYMHNRARMIVSSVLTKNLGVDWRWGQEYFRAMLIDLDEASNNGGWQWGSSVGADPKPIRIFNPYLQAESYDQDGHYRKKYLSKDYFENPPPIIIEHKTARAEALERYKLSGKVKPRDY